MDPLFRQCGIYNHVGQLYEPVDSDQVLYYREATDGQILEEGITEAGSMASFIAAGTSYATHGVTMIPMFIYYSMFGFQRIGDLIWAALDCRAKGFMFGGTAGRTTLAGEGLAASRWQQPPVRDRLSERPQLRSGLRLRIDRHHPRRHAADVRAVRRRDLLHHHRQRKLRNAGHARRMSSGRDHPRHLQAFDASKPGGKAPHVQLFGSGAILREVQRAQKLLAEKFGVSSTVWSVTSYKELRRDAQASRRWNMLHPTETP